MSLARYFSCLIAILLFGGTASAQQPAAKPLQVLLVTGVEYEGHPWRETAPRIAKQLETSPEIQVRVEPDYNVLCTDEIFRYDVMFFNFKNYDPLTDDEKALDNIAKFLEQGKGIVLFHFAIGVFENHRAKVEKLFGRYYDPALPPHDPFGEFEVRIVEKNHPITKHLDDFKILDELYTCLGGTTEPIEVLCVADSKITKKPESMGHLHKYGKGFAFTTVLGHDNRALDSAGFATLLRNAVLWLGHRAVPAEPAKVVPKTEPLDAAKKN